MINDMIRKNPRKPIERIQVSKNDEIALVVERIIDANADEVVLTIPRFSRLIESSANFHLIKREADLLNKRVVIETVDDKAIKLAEGVGLDSLNPLFVKKRQFSDIVSAPAMDIEKPVSKTSSEPVPAMTSSAPEADSEELAGELAPQTKVKKRRKFSFSNSKPQIRLPKRKALITTVVIIGAILVIASIAKLLPKADIIITTTKIPWEFGDTLTLSKNEGTAQLFHDSRNMTVAFPASGIQKIQKYATGKITVYNAYSSEAQPLVRRTRFVTPDGKIFRLTEGITVPPAKVVEGKIIPSSIEAAVIADEPGIAHNVGSISRFSVPGFKGTAKYEGFYGKSTQPMSGGFVGEAAVPTDGDIRGAKDNVAERIKQALEAALLGTLPADFKVVDGASKFQITKQSVVTETDASGQFSVFTEAEMDLTAFKETDIIAMLKEKMRIEFGVDYDFKDLQVDYGEAKADFSDGSLKILVTARGQAHQPIDKQALQAQVLGRSENSLRALISSLAGFEDGQVSFWPFWVKDVPARSNRVTIDIR
jgi:hypothetical protein